MAERALHIALTFDDRFWAPAYASMRSVCVSTRRRADLVFHLCHQGLQAAHRADIDTLAAQYGVTIRHYPLEQNDVLSDALKHLPRSGTPRWTEIVYARLFIHRILPAEVKRLVYLDCDVFVRRPVEELFDLDLEDRVFGAVEAVYHIEAQVERGFTPKLELFDPADRYFNSGVLVIDMEKWAAIDIVAEFLALLGPRAKDQHFLDSLMLDQDVLNLVFRGRWLELDYRWNFQNPLPEHERLLPYIVHYCGYRKPWFILGGTAFHRHYRHLMTDRIFYAFWRERMARKLSGWRDWLRIIRR